jgi:hypothetical protein
VRLVTSSPTKDGDWDGSGVWMCLGEPPRLAWTETFETRNLVSY